MGTRHQGSKGEKRALDSFIKLMRAANAVASRVHRHLAADRLTESQFAVLEALHHLGPLSQKDLSAKILKSGANVTTVVDNLEKRGLVERRRGTEDRRMSYVHLTADGETLIRTVFPRHVAAVVEAMGHLGTTKQGELARLCRNLGRKAAE